MYIILYNVKLFFEGLTKKIRFARPLSRRLFELNVSLFHKPLDSNLNFNFSALKVPQKSILDRSSIYEVGLVPKNAGLVNTKHFKIEVIFAFKILYKMR